MTEIQNRPDVLVVDDDLDMHEAFRRSLEDQFSITSVLSGEEAVSVANQRIFPVACVDLVMHGISGTETLKQLKQANRFQSVIIITGHESVASAVDALNLGAFKYVIKPFPFEYLADIVLQAHRRYDDEITACASAIDAPGQLESHGLSPREAEVAFNVIQGGTPAEISKRLNISRRTIEKHLQRIFERLGVSTATRLGPRLRELRYNMFKKLPFRG